MSDTPRTDAEELPHSLDDHHFVVGSFFARKLERELNAAQQRIKRLEEARTVAAANSLATMMSYEDAIAKIKQLENLGKELRECASQLGWTSSEDPRWLKRAEAAVEAWDKFNKETKQ